MLENRWCTNLIIVLRKSSEYNRIQREKYSLFIIRTKTAYMILEGEIMEDLNAYLYHGIRFIMAGIFMASGIIKLADNRSFEEAVLRYEVLTPKNARLYALLTPWVEFSSGAALLANIGVFSAVCIQSVLLVSFLIAVSVNLMRGRTLECHCFGKLHSQPLSRRTVLRIIALEGATAYLGVQSLNAPPVLDSIGLASVVVIICVAVLAYGSLRYAIRVLSYAKEGR